MQKCSWLLYEPQPKTALSCAGPPTGAIKDAIEKDFGSVEEFKKQFSQAGATQFGSGWAWLVLGSDGKLKVGSAKHHLKYGPHQGPRSRDMQQLLGLAVDAPD